MTPRHRSTALDGFRLVCGSSLLIASGWLGSLPAAAQPAPRGSDLQVNTYTWSFQQLSSIGVDTFGNFVVAWASTGSDGSDSSAESIHARRFAADGTALGPGFQVNTYTTGSQDHPALSVSPFGSFVVVWESYGSSGTDDSFKSIQARAFDAFGLPIRDQFQVNLYTDGIQYGTSVSSSGNGDFVVTWVSEGSDASDDDGTAIQARRFDLRGEPLGGEFQVNSYTTGNQLYPAVDFGPEGSFIVAWESWGSAGGDTDRGSIQARRFDASGEPVGSEFQVNTWTTLRQTRPDVAVDASGRFVVAWDGYGSTGSDQSALSVHLRRYDAGGVAAGDEVQVNQYSTGHQLGASVDATADGSVVVAWWSYGSSGTDTSYSSIQARNCHVASDCPGNEFQVNVGTESFQFRPAVAAVPAGEFVVTWTSWISEGDDDSLSSVQVRRYDALLSDGFESGDTSRWSSTSS
ncbi:MAG: hypothetical protein AMXMBFR36_18540 [Acidobacteriota bacterium]